MFKDKCKVCGCFIGNKIHSCEEIIKNRKVRNERTNWYNQNKDKIMELNDLQVLI